MSKQHRNTDFKKSFSSTTIWLFLISFVIFTAFQFAFLDDVFLLATKFNLIEVGDDIKEIDFENDDYKITLADYEANHNFYLEIYSPKDVLIYTTESNESIYDTSNNTTQRELKPRIMRILSRTENEDRSYFEMRREYFATAEYIVYGNFISEDIGFEVYYSLDAIRDSATTASWALSSLTIIMFFMVLITINLTTRKFTKPLQRIIDTTKNMADMDFSQPCPTFKFKDLNELSQSINTLSQNLSSALTKLESENKQLEYDIEVEKRIEKTRRTFIANVSHELKTPIAIIQGYAEGMKLGIGCETTDEFCDIIIEEAQKMNNLVVRLMEYMHYNSGTYKATYTSFNLYEFVYELVESRKLQLKEQSIEVIIDIPKDALCYADAVLTENIFNNYISNAISHIDFERKIYISSKDLGECHRISVLNTGKPIPGTDIQHIWESFYRGDKSHSREQGRFGLGLSIVATSQDIMGQKYGVNNTNDGPEFWFDIQKKP